MKDFQNKILRITLNENSGCVIEQGLYIDMNDDFIVLKNTFNHKIRYISKYIIRYVEIVQSVNELGGYNND